MALTAPDREALLEHMHEEDFGEGFEEVWADDALQQATDLMQMATGLSTDPTDEFALRIMRTGILAMAHALIVRAGDAAATYSPFQSERIGSYSYSKMATAVAAQEGTGVAWFDQAVAYLLGLLAPEDMPTSTTSERVFNPGGLTYAQQEFLRDPWSLHDSSGR